MDYISTKAVYIAVGIFVTISIVSGIMFIMNQISNVYSDVNSTDVNIKNRFSEYTMYENVELSGLDLINTVKKYSDYNNVKICIGTNTDEINNTDFINKTKLPSYNKEIEYKKNYNVNVEPKKNNNNDDTEIMLIIFKEK
ncbi:MAG: hypothetical protein RSE41_06705 [Clostridia bacterium]